MASVRNTAQDAPQLIQVYVRLRPFNKQENQTRCVEINFNEISPVGNSQKKFSFDGVFGPESKQVSVYKTIGKPLISEILAGYNCTVFAYGQTGTGKTFTMSGGITELSTLTAPQESDAAKQVFLCDDSGLIPRFVAELFEELSSFPQEYTVQCSYLELYNEELRDLLAVGGDPCPLRIYGHQHHKGSVIIQGIQEVTVHNKTEVFNLLQKAYEKRQVASTQMNERSSRSHTVFTIIVHTRETSSNGEDIVKSGKLNLVDLAGSENVSRSGSVNCRAREAGSINQSLLTLGRVIKALAESSCHIPFRESKLTRILQDSLGGRTKTIIIATISPCISALDETLSTLDYAFKARVITNKPEVNQRMSQRALMLQYAQEKSRLERDLEAARSREGIILDPDSYQRLLMKQETTKEQISRSSAHILKLEEQLKSLEEHKNLVEIENIALRKSFEETCKELEKAKKLTDKIEAEKKEQEFLATRYEENAKNLQKELESILTIVETSSCNQKVLGQKIESLHQAANLNHDLMKKMDTDIIDLCNDMLSELNNQETHLSKFQSSINESVNTSIKSIHNHSEEVNEYLDFMQEELKNVFNSSSSFDETSESLKECENLLLHLNKDLANYINMWDQNSMLQFDSSLEHYYEYDTNMQNSLVTNLNKRLNEIELVTKSSSNDFLTYVGAIQNNILGELHKLSENSLSKSNISSSTLTEITELKSQLLTLINEKFEPVRAKIISNGKQNEKDIEDVGNIQTLISTGLQSIQNKMETESDNISKITSDVTFNSINNYDSNEIVKKYDTLIKNCFSKLTNENLLGEDYLANALTENKKLSDEVVHDSLLALQNHRTTLIDTLKDNCETIKILNTKTKTVQEKIIEDAAVSSQAIDDVSQSVCSFSNNMTNMLDDLHTLTSRTNQEVLEVNPTGNTPVRPELKCPMKLKDLTPKERILSRFRRMQSGSVHNKENQPIDFQEDDSSSETH